MLLCVAAKQRESILQAELAESTQLTQTRGAELAHTQATIAEQAALIAQYEREQAEMKQQMVRFVSYSASSSTFVSKLLGGAKM